MFLLFFRVLWAFGAFFSLFSGSHNTENTFIHGVPTEETKPESSVGKWWREIRVGLSLWQYSERVRSVGVYDYLRHIEGAYMHRLWWIWCRYYYSFIEVGSPPQEVTVVLDTGSTLTAFPCKNCDECGKHMHPRFDPEESSTSKMYHCSTGCPRIAKSCSRQDKCFYEEGYMYVLNVLITAIKSTMSLSLI